MKLSIVYFIFFDIKIKYTLTDLNFNFFKLREENVKCGECKFKHLLVTFVL